MKNVSQNLLRVLILDDEKIVSFGLDHLLKVKFMSLQIDYCFSIQEFSNFRNNLILYDLIILDPKIVMDKTPVSFIDELLRGTPQLNLLVFTSLPMDNYVQRLYSLGVKGFLTKKAKSEDIYRATELALVGKHFFSKEYKNYLVNTEEPGADYKIHSLSNRELEILRLLLKGHGTKDISLMLHLHISSVTTYKKRIFNKLDVNNIIELYKMVEKTNVGIFDYE